MQKELALPFPKCVWGSLTLFNQQSHTHNHSQVSLTVAPESPKKFIIHHVSLLLSSHFSLSDAPFLGAQGDHLSPLLLIGVGSCLETSPGALTYPVAVTGELVRPSNKCSQVSAVQRVGTPVW